ISPDYIFIIGAFTFYTLTLLIGANTKPKFSTFPQYQNPFIKINLYSPTSMASFHLKMVISCSKAKHTIDSDTPIYFSGLNSVTHLLSN
ncbi:hypothetical protein ACT3R9_14050, partial [Psychrobacter sp. AOP42-A1-21]|uniref:hypothetical protein n=1 Tax=Psychrobacter sp. AOP42-A1-21 TaxID=3457675 RepID=UPI004035F777